MNSFGQSNILEAGTASVAELFADYLENAHEVGRNCTVLTLSERTLGQDARTAVEKSLEALGYGERACAYANLSPCGSADGDADGAPLDGQALFLLVEGLDPLCVIAADEAATHALADAYRTTFEPDAPIRVFGRPAVAFRNLPALVTTPQGKQRAWHLFKSIPRISKGRGA